MAANAGCSSVKFQNFETDEVYIKGPKAGKYQLLGKEIPIYDLHKTLEIEVDFLSACKEYAERPGQEKKQKPLYNKAEGPTSLGQTDPGIFTASSSFAL